MSKSSGNTILLSDSPEEILRKTKTAVTDVQKVRKNDPGRPEVCGIFTYHQKFNPGEIGEIESGCRAGSLGCVDCKTRIAKKISDHLAPVREKRAALEAAPQQVRDILADGENRARQRAQATMQEVRTAMKLG